MHILCTLLMLSPTALQESKYKRQIIDELDIKTWNKSELHEKIFSWKRYSLEKDILLKKNSLEKDILFKKIPLEVCSLVWSEAICSVLSDTGDKLGPCAWEQHAANNQLSICRFSISEQSLSHKFIYIYVWFHPNEEMKMHTNSNHVFWKACSLSRAFQICIVWRI